MASIEGKVFQRKRFDFAALEPYGFRRTDAGYEYIADFMDGDFKAVLWVDDTGAVEGVVIDAMNDEEYAQLRCESFKGAYVSSVRAAYEEILESIARRCCKDVLFASDQANRLTDYILDRFDVNPDFPFGQTPYQSYGVFRHADNNKWFALVMNVKWDALLKNACEDTVDIINLKIVSASGDELRARDGIFPAYHMNHEKWISVVLDDTLCDDAVFELVETSFDLTR